MGDLKVKGPGSIAGIVPTHDVVQTKVLPEWKAQVGRVSNALDQGRLRRICADQLLIRKRAARPDAGRSNLASGAWRCESVNSFRLQGADRTPQRGKSPRPASHVVPQAERVEPGNVKKLIAYFERWCGSAAMSSNTLTTDGAGRPAVTGLPTPYPPMKLEPHLNVLKMMERKLAGAKSRITSMERVTIGGAGPGQDSGVRTVNEAAVCEDMRSGQWQSTLFDLAPHVITSTPRWPRNVRLLIVDAQGNSLGTYGGEHAREPSVVKLVLNNEHYDVEIDGTLRKMAGDGNCFFHSICAGLGSDVNRLLFDDSGEPHQRLRKTVENLLIEHLPKYWNSLNEDDRKRYFLPASKA